MKEPTVLIMAPIMFFVGILEAIGEIAKVASLSFRLYGNVFAGEVLLASMAAIFSFILPIPFLFLEFFVGIIQAFIFAMLTLVYFSISATDHDEHNSAHHDEKHLVAHAPGSV
jgi:F-type H+-transporting ATPase subunit a